MPPIRVLGRGQQWIRSPPSREKSCVRTLLRKYRVERIKNMTLAKRVKEMRTVMHRIKSQIQSATDRDFATAEQGVREAIIGGEVSDDEAYRSEPRDEG
eukprot:9496662-Pyramimonas_sp.AAC.1